MWNSIKDLISSLWLRKERERFNRLAERYQRLCEEQEGAQADFEAYKASLTVVDLVREQLKGINPKILEGDNDLLVDLGAEDSLDSFLAGCHDLHKSRELSRIIEYLERDQVLYSAKTAVGLDEINFARATINGLCLLREEVARLDTVYEERHASQPKFDEFEVT